MATARPALDPSYLNSPKSFFEKWAPTFLALFVMIGGWVGTVAAMSTRLSEVEERTNKIEIRYEREVVPRVEYDARNMMLKERLDQMQKTLDKIEEATSRRPVRQGTSSGDQ